MNIQTHPRGDISQAQVPNIFDTTSGRSVIVRGRQLDVQDLQERVGVGFRSRHTGSPCGLRALQVGLESVCSALGRQHETYDNLLNIFNSADFAQVAQHYVQQQSRSHQQADRDTFAAGLWAKIRHTQNLSVDALRLVLRFLEQHYGVLLALGTCALAGQAPNGEATYISKVHDRILPNPDVGLEGCNIVWLVHTGSVVGPAGHQVPTWAGIAQLDLQEGTEVTSNDRRHKPGHTRSVRLVSENQRVPGGQDAPLKEDEPEIVKPPSRDCYPTDLTEDELIDRWPGEIFDELLLYVLRKYPQRDLLRLLTRRGQNIRGDALRQRKHAALERRCQRKCNERREISTAEASKACREEYDQEVKAFGTYMPRGVQGYEGEATEDAEARRTRHRRPAGADGVPTITVQRAHRRRPLPTVREMRSISATATDHRRASIESISSSGSPPVSPNSPIRIYDSDDDPQQGRLIDTLPDMEPAEEFPSWLIQDRKQRHQGSDASTFRRHCVDTRRLKPQTKRSGVNKTCSASRRGSKRLLDRDLTNAILGLLPALERAQARHRQVQQPHRDASLLSPAELRRFYRRCNAPRRAGHTLGVGPPGTPSIPFIWRTSFRPPMLTIEQIMWYDQYWARLPIPQRRELTRMRDVVLSLRHGQLHHVRDEVARTQDARGSGTERWHRKPLLSLRDGHWFQDDEEWEVELYTDAPTRIE